MTSNYEQEINRLLAYTLEVQASDLHLVVGKPPVVRIDGKLSSVSNYDILEAEALEKILFGVLSDLQKKNLESKKHVDFSLAFKDKARFRVNVYYQKNTLAGAFRHIPSKIRALTELNLPGQLENFTKFKQGLFLVVGPTGHGKSTTLAALIDIINHDRPDHIITIEDPIEYLFMQDKAIISQREVQVDTPDFASAIRATLREDVNVVMIGEMRDLESIATTLTVAETGHLVFSTLHTNDAMQTLDRIVDVFPAHQQNQIRAQLASVILGIVSQRLLPRVGGGLLPATEVLITNGAVRNVIREGRTHELVNIIHTSLNEGMWILDRNLAELTKRGLIKLEDGIAYANDKDFFKSLVKRF